MHGCSLVSKLVGTVVSLSAVTSCNGSPTVHSSVQIQNEIWVHVNGPAVFAWINKGHGMKQSASRFVPCCAVFFVRRSGKYSTDKAALKALMDQHPLPGIILQFRKLAKNMSEMHARIQDSANAAAAAGNSRGAAAAADDAAVAAAGLVRVRGQWLQTCHASGRLSSEEPSLQCVANNIQYEMNSTIAAAQPDTYADSDNEDNDNGEADAPSRPSAGPAAAGPSACQPQQQQQQQQQGMQVYTASVRSGFVAPPGCVILGADYCQIEFRLMAHFSGDAGLLRAFSCGEDPFRALGANWLKKPSQQVGAVCFWITCHDADGCIVHLGFWRGIAATIAATPGV